MILRALTVEQRMMVRKPRLRVLEHKEGIRKRLTVVLPAQEAKTGQPLAPILGQVQIMVSEFVDYFNEESEEYPVGFPLLVEILVGWDKNYSINFEPVPFSYFIHDFLLLTPLVNRQTHFSEYVEAMHINDLYKLFLWFTVYFKLEASLVHNEKCIFKFFLSLLSILKITVTLITIEDFCIYLSTILEDPHYRTLFFTIISEYNLLSIRGVVNSEEPPTIEEFLAVKKTKLKSKKGYKRYGISHS